MKYKLIALDLDGTLLDDDHRLSAGTIAAVRAVHERGAVIVLCTGRGPGNAIPVMRELGLEGTIITHNGAATIRTEDKALVHHFPFSREELIPFIEYCKSHRIHYDVSTPFHLHVDAEPEPYAMEMYRTFMIEPVVHSTLDSIQEEPVKFTVYAEDKTLLDRVESDWAGFRTRLSVLRSGDCFIDIMDPQASKGNALQKLAERIGIEPGEVLAIGNYFNDLDMIRYAGMGIAMANSPEAVKEAADEVTASNNDEGVRLALEKHCLAALPKKRKD